MFSILESVAFDTGYAGSNGLEPQSWVNGNGTSYIYFGSGEFDGQGSGHDFYGTVSCSVVSASGGWVREKACGWWRQLHAFTCLLHAYGQLCL